MKSNLNKYKKATTLEMFLPEIEKLMKPTDGEKITMIDLLEAMRMLQTEDIVVLFGQNKQNQQFKLQKEISDI